MFDIGLQEMLVIGVLALLVFGPSKLPELGRMVGRALRELRRASEDFRSTLETNLRIDDADSPPNVIAANVAGTAVSDDVTTLGLARAPEARPVDEAAATGVEIWQPTEPFCAQSGSRLFHRRECSWAARIRDRDRVPLKSVADARAQGYLTCPVCDPSEPA